MDNNNMEQMPEEEQNSSADVQQAMRKLTQTPTNINNNLPTFSSNSHNKLDKEESSANIARPNRAPLNQETKQQGLPKIDDKLKESKPLNSLNKAGTAINNAADKAKQKAQK